MADQRDPEVTDLRQYKKSRERARKMQARAKRGADEPLLGGRPRAGVILALVIAILVAMGAFRWLSHGGLAPGASHAQIPASRGGNQ
jgi:hypothetical protein